MTSTPKPTSELSAAAVLLDQELRKFEELSDLAGRIKLNSEKNLERATEALTRAAESQDRIAAHVRSLVAAVSAARERQEQDANALMARAQEISRRRTRFAEIVEQMAALGGVAKEIQTLLQQEKSKETVGQVQQRLQAAEERAGELARLAGDEEMEDLARQADSLRQQLQSARNKLNLLAQKLEQGE